MVDAFAEAAGAIALNWHEILEQVGIPIALAFEPDAKVSADLVVRAINMAAAASGREDIGLLIAQGTRSQFVTALAMAFRAQATVRSAVKMLARHAAFQNDIEEHEVEDHDGLLILKRRLRPRSMASNRYCIDCSVGLSVMEMRTLLGPSWKPEMACFRMVLPTPVAWTLPSLPLRSGRISLIN